MDVVTGSFGFIGKYITRELLNSGRQVRTITTHPEKHNPFGDHVQSFPYDFQSPDLLIDRLKGCDYLFNTYWVRFNYQQWSFDNALEETKTLFDCAKKANVKKIIHISVTNPSESDILPYYKGKALQEKALRASGVPWSIVRPTLVFGQEDILVNNIAWTLRKFPIIPVFGDGEYKVQPVFVEDLASIAVARTKDKESQIVDAIGPETFTYKAFLQLIATELQRHVFLMPIKPKIGILLGKILGLFVKDVVLTEDELRGLMANKLVSTQKPSGKTAFSDWLTDNKDILGTEYTSELGRHFHWRPH